MPEENKFKLVFVDKNSIKPAKENSYREVYQARKRLKKKDLVGQKNHELLIKKR